METKFVLIIIIAVSVGAATLIENDSGPEAARALVYNARWFEILLFFLMVNLMGNIIRYRLWRKEKWFSFLFHISFLIILLGAEVTHYVGYEGSLHFREGETSHTFLSAKAHLKITIREGDEEFTREKPLRLTSVTRNRFTETVDAGNEKVIIRYAGFIPGAEKSLIEDPSGSPILLLSLADGRHSRDMIIELGEKTHFDDVHIAFQSHPNPDEKNVRIQMKDNRLTLIASERITVTSMRQRATSELQAQKEIEFTPMTVYRIGSVQMVLKAFYPGARIVAAEPSSKNNMNPTDALIVDVASAGKFQRISLFGKKGTPGETVKILSGSETIELAYGSREIPLPFGLNLVDFQMERYPGSDNPSSYASNVIILDQEKGLEKKYRIYMNHILKYRGFRFFQSFYDQDEKGSILTVSYDPGTPVTYLGFILMVVSLFAHLFHPRRRFR